jgi:multiple antibiotic resistance protein
MALVSLHFGIFYLNAIRVCRLLPAVSPLRESGWVESIGPESSNVLISGEGYLLYIQLMPDIPEILKALIAIVVLINPLEGVPIYLARSARLSASERLLVARKASLTVLILLLAAMGGGKAVLYLFGIQIASFTMAGGLIILLIALNMVLAPPKDGTTSGGTGDFAIVPLGTPLLAGPGPISSVIIFSSQGIGGHDTLWKSDFVLFGLIVVAALFTYFCLRLAIPVGNLLGATGINVMTRLAGILVAAIAAQMIVSGALASFPGWK